MKAGTNLHEVPVQGEKEGIRFEIHFKQSKFQVTQANANLKLSSITVSYA